MQRFQPYRWLLALGQVLVLASPYFPKFLQLDYDRVLEPRAEPRCYEVWGVPTSYEVLFWLTSFVGALNVLFLFIPTSSRSIPVANRVSSFGARLILLSYSIFVGLNGIENMSGPIWPDRRFSDALYLGWEQRVGNIAGFFILVVSWICNSRKIEKQVNPFSYVLALNVGYWSSARIWMVEASLYLRDREHFSFVDFTLSGWLLYFAGAALTMVGLAGIFKEHQPTNSPVRVF